MGIVKNRATQNGDIIVISTQIPILGVVLLKGFTDSVLGENSHRYFNKTFRYSLDGGLNYSNWAPLTTNNIQLIPINPVNVFFIEYAYERVDDVDYSLSDSDLVFNSNNLLGEFADLLEGPIYNLSIFKKYFSTYDVKVLNWCLNVLEKLYRKGIIPNYITRGENNNRNNEDEDYVAFWCSVCCFFSLFVNFARLFEEFENEEIIETYLLQKGIYFCNESSDINDLIYIMNNFYNEISKRGTLQIVSSKGDIYQVNGELRRLFCSEAVCQPLIFSLTETHKFGWNIGSSSPLYRGNMGADMAVIGFENHPTEIDLDKYPLQNDSQITIYSELVSPPNNYNQELIKFKLNLNSSVTGIKTEILSSPSKEIFINNKISFEISFDYRVIDETDLLMYFGCLAYDKNNNQITLNNLGGGTDDFFYIGPFNGILNKWYTFKGIVYGLNVDSGNVSLAPLNGQGYLQFNNNIYNPCKIIPQIYIDSDGSSSSLTSPTEVHIANIRVRPLSTPYSTGFVQTKNWINVWGENFNKKFSKNEIKNIERKFLVPYDSYIENIWVDESSTNEIV